MSRNRLKSTFSKCSRSTRYFIHTDYPHTMNSIQYYNVATVKKKFVIFFFFLQKKTKCNSKNLLIGRSFYITYVLLAISL